MDINDAFKSPIAKKISSGAPKNTVKKTPSSTRTPFSPPSRASNTRGVPKNVGRKSTPLKKGKK